MTEHKPLKSQVLQVNEPTGRYGTMDDKSCHCELNEQSFELTNQEVPPSGTSGTYKPYWPDGRTADQSDASANHRACFCVKSSHVGIPVPKLPKVEMVNWMKYKTVGMFLLLVSALIWGIVYGLLMAWDRI